MSATRVVSYGHAGVLVELEALEARLLPYRTREAALALQREFPESEVVAGLGTVGLFGSVPTAAEIDAALSRQASAKEVARTHQLEVTYDGPDLSAVSQHLAIAPEALVELHSGAEYTVQTMGFLPGFGYLGPLSERLFLNRRSVPRRRVEAGSLAIAASYTGIYPFASPGGWHLLGRYLGEPLFDAARAEPLLLQLGDKVRFIPSERSAPKARVGRTLEISLSIRQEVRPHLRVESPAPLTSIQDAGRPRSLARGLPPSGPLDPDTFLAVSRALENDPSCAALEVWGGTLRVRAFGEPWLAVPGLPPFRPREGELVQLDASDGPKYLAIAGGFQADLLLHSHSTHVAAGFGGAKGRRLGKGDVLRARRPDRELTPSTDAPPCATLETAPDGPITLRLADGPHAHLMPDRAWDTLLGSTYSVSPNRDRTGVRLEGPPLPLGDLTLAGPIPIIRGAMQIPPNGLPIVLGPDHPITGGYPVPAVLHPNDFGRFSRATDRTRIRFKRWDRA